jgi:hypothetical protein
MALMPPIGMHIPFTEKVAWVWLVLISGFLGICTLFFEINLYVKALTALCFVNTFFSKAPFISQWAYMQVVGCVYLYIACLHIEDWSKVFRALYIVLGINILLLLLQHIGKDNLLNFGFSRSSCRGVVGNVMQFRSYMIVLIALIIQSIPLVKKRVKEAFWIVAVILFAYAYVHMALPKFLISRGPAWFETFRTSLAHPWIGWGLGTYKATFQSVSGILLTTARSEGAWLTAHNDWLQVMYEIGIPGFMLMVAYAWDLIKKCKGALLLGALMVIYTLTVHFPMRTTQIVPLLILFIAYIERKHSYAGTKSN